MSGISDMLPSDASEQAEIQRILREQPDLAAMIETAQARAREVVVDPRFSLDTRQYDDWDPPLRLVISADIAESDYQETLRRFIHWLAHDASYDYPRLTISLSPQAIPASAS